MASSSSVVQVDIETDDVRCLSKKEISTSPTHPLVPTVIQPDGTVADNQRRHSIIYPRPSSSRSHRDRKKHGGSSESFRRSHEVICTVNEGLDGDIFGPGVSLRPNILAGVGYSPQRRLTLADALIPRSASSKSSCSSPRRHSAADTDQSDVQPEITLEALLIAGSRRNSLRVDDHLSRRSSRSSRSSSRRRSNSSKRHRKVSTASAISGLDRYSNHDSCSAPSAVEEEEEEDEEVVRKRARIARVVGSVAATILLGAILLVALTLHMTPTIDEIVRKENEDILQKWKGGPLLENATTEAPSSAEAGSDGNLSLSTAAPRRPGRALFTTSLSSDSTQWFNKDKREAPPGPLRSTSPPLTVISVYSSDRRRKRRNSIAVKEHEGSRHTRHNRMPSSSRQFMLIREQDITQASASRTLKMNLVRKKEDTRTNISNLFKLLDHWKSASKARH